MKKNRKLSSYRKGYTRAMIDLSSFALTFGIYTYIAYRFLEKLFM